MIEIDAANPLIVLHLADGSVVVLEVEEAGQFVETQIAPDGSTSVEVVPRLHS